jgi:hypothetical protein
VKTSKYLPKIDQNLWTKFSPIDSPVIGNIHGEDLVKAGNFLMFRNELVHSEFVNLSKIPFHIFTTIRDPFPSFSKMENRKAREDYCKELAEGLNSKVLEKYPDIPSFNKTARFVRVEEFGQSVDEVHVHLLWHLHKDALHLAEEILSLLENLEPKEFRGVRCFDNQMIHDRLGIVSYVCKIEKGREEKYVGYSPHFYPIVARKILKGHWQ